MAEPATRRWEELDPETQKTLEAQYMAELPSWAEPGLSDEALRAYIEYRRERPDVAITTYEEGQIRKLLHGMSNPSAVPDPVEQEEHVGRLEAFGAEKLHLTNSQTYVGFMVLLTFVAIIAFLVWLMLM